MGGAHDGCWAVWRKGNGQLFPNLKASHNNDGHFPGAYLSDGQCAGGKRSLSLSLSQAQREGLHNMYWLPCFLAPNRCLPHNLTIDGDSMHCI